MATELKSWNSTNCNNYLLNCGSSLVIRLLSLYASVSQRPLQTNVHSIYTLHRAAETQKPSCIIHTDCDGIKKPKGFPKILTVYFKDQNYRLTASCIEKQ